MALKPSFRGFHVHVPAGLALLAAFSLLISLAVGLSLLAPWR